MIYTTAELTIKNNSTFLDKPIILYRGDKNVEVQFILKERIFAQYEINEQNIIDELDASFGQIVFVNPSGNVRSSDIAATRDGKVIFVIPKEMIDEKSEVGIYTLQIRLYDKQQTSRVTLPPCVDGLIVREPIAIEN